MNEPKREIRRTINVQDGDRVIVDVVGEVVDIVPPTLKQLAQEQRRLILHLQREALRGQSLLLSELPDQVRSLEALESLCHR